MRTASHLTSYRGERIRNFVATNAGRRPIANQSADGGWRIGQREFNELAKKDDAGNLFQKVDGSNVNAVD
jgi:hypothetical protein